jgi:hypothetical protein
MQQHLKTYRKVYSVLVILIILLLSYFFWTKTFKVSDEEKIHVHIDKQINGISCNYEFNQQEVRDFVKILEKAKFRRGVSRPDRMFADKSIHVIVQGNLGPIITIYYDDDKTYVFANISTPHFLNVYYRISNKKEIREFIEKIVVIKSDEFVKAPIQ